MKLNIRVICSNYSLDYEVQEDKELVIDCNSADDFGCRKEDIKGSIKFVYSNGVWKAFCDGETFLNNDKPHIVEINGDELFTLSLNEKNRLFILPYYDELEKINVSLSNYEVFRIGRKNTSDLIISSPRVSGSHVVIAKEGEKYLLADDNSRNGTFINGKRVSGKTLEEGDVIYIDKQTIEYRENKLICSNIQGQVSTKESMLEGARKTNSIKDRKEYPLFKKSPRLKYELPKDEFVVQQPPTIGSKPEINWLAVLAAPIGMILIMIMVVVVMKGSTVSIVYTAPMSLLSIVTSVLNYKGQIKKHKKNEQTRIDVYNDHLYEIAGKCTDASQKQMKALLSVHPSTVECFNIVNSLERRLWERNFNDSDFMDLRVGTGSVETSFSIKVPNKTVKLEKDELQEKAYELEKKYSVLKDAPISFNIRKNISCGIIGDKKSSSKLAKNMVLQAVTHHSYDDLKIITLYGKEDSEWEFIKWLPHSFDAGREERFVGSNFFDAEKILKEFEEIIKTRKNDDASAHTNVTSEIQRPFYLFVITEKEYLEDNKILKFFSGRDDLNIGVIYVFDEINDLPKDCNVIIETKLDKGFMYMKNNVDIKKRFTFDRFSENDYESFARSMAPIRLYSSANNSTLPNSITFLEGYGVNMPEELPIGAWWQRAKTYQTMGVPIGVKENGEPFIFDIHERKHGPHGLVAGMTGSGKSEMVQSWILSMALKFSPQDVAFVLIDFKGTGLILPFSKLPHLAGTISDLDTNITRNLISLENELTRRKALLDKYGVNNISAYLKLREAGKAHENMPFLFIIIDEFAEFKEQFREFIPVINRIFAIGRTLGVFTVLLTQKPSGVVDDKMNANTRFRWCLKVANVADSKEMLHHPDAARITVPGRAYIQVGEDEIYEQIQSFWSGAPFDPDGRKRGTDGQISVVQTNGKRKRYILKPEEQSTVSGKTEIETIVEYISSYVKKRDIPDAQRIWTERLPEIIDLSKLIEIFKAEKTCSANDGISAIIGLVDNPKKQMQYPLEINLTDKGHVAIYGAPTTGKTTLLKTFVLSLCCRYSPDEVNLYILDFGGWGMNVFLGYPHVGGVIIGDEREKMEKFITMISEKISERKHLFAAEGVGNIKEYNRIAPSRVPELVIVLDNYSTALGHFPELEDLMINLTREGGNVGMYLVATCSSAMSLGFKVSQNIRYSLALQMTDKADYSTILGKSAAILPSVCPGRGLCAEDEILEFQTALPSVEADEAERSREIKKIGSSIMSSWKGKKADAIPIMPDVIHLSDYFDEKICIGLDTKDCSKVIMPLGDIHTMLISGTIGSGKTTILRATALQCVSDSKCVLVDSIAHGLAAVKNVAEYYCDNALDFDIYMEKLVVELERRRKIVQEGLYENFEGIFIIIDDYYSLFKEVDNKTMERLEAVIRLGKNLKVYIIAAANNADISKLYNQGEDFTVGLVNQKNGIMMGGSPNDHSIFSIDLPYTEKSRKMSKNEGFLINQNSLVKFRIIDDEKTESEGK
ncbi:MAG: type VII secretion protein EssC [Anaerovoracaceae bacterium]